MWVSFTQNTNKVRTWHSVSPLGRNHRKDVEWEGKGNPTGNVCWEKIYKNKDTLFHWDIIIFEPKRNHYWLLLLCPIPWETNKKINHLGTRDSHSPLEKLILTGQLLGSYLFLFYFTGKTTTIFLVTVHPLSRRRGVEWATEASKASLAIYPPITTCGRARQTRHSIAIIFHR